MSAPTIELHIEELVLHGFAPAERYAIGDALQAELARLLGAAAPLAQLPAQPIERADGGTFVARDARAQTIGAQVAQAIVGAIDGTVQA